MSLLNIKPQTVKIELNHLHVMNINKVFKFASEVLKHPIID